MSVKAFTHKDLVKLANEKFGLGVKRWWAKGPHTVRLRLASPEETNYETNKDLFFTFYSEKSWKLETTEMFHLSKDGV